MRGGNKSTKKTNRVKRAVLVRFGYFRPRIVSGMPPGKSASVKSKICRMGAKFWPHYVLGLRQPTLPARDMGFRLAESVVYLFSWSFVPVLIWPASAACCAGSAAPAVDGASGAAATAAVASARSTPGESKKEWGAEGGSTKERSVHCSQGGTNTKQANWWRAGGSPRALAI